MADSALVTLSENDTFIETLLGQFAVNIRLYFEHTKEIITNAVIRAKEIITPKATVRELCIEGDDGETICLKKDDVKALMQSHNVVPSSGDTDIDNTDNTSPSDESGSDTEVSDADTSGDTSTSSSDTPSTPEVSPDVPDVPVSEPSV